ncbi:MAG: hypothetical protein FJW39_16845 [Acidobacteria bacterium]|nr:hypothetical protein [Acidobacteriota bacterium]
MLLDSKGLCEFGPFRFDRRDRTLWRDGKLIPLTPKALDTLAALIATPGRLVEKDDLIKAVWPDAFVEEGNLAVQISLLRKTFGGEGYIETIPRRGYRFVAPLTEAAGAVDPLPPAPTPHQVAVGTATVTRRLLTGAAIGSVAGALFWGFRYRRAPTREIGIASVAVLPFQVIEGKPEDAGTGLGLTDAVITRLGSLNKFIVRPTSAVRQFDQPSRDPAAVGAKLDVEAVLDATIQSANGRIRVNAQLIRVSNRQHVWADTFDLERSDLFTLEDQLSSRLAHSFFGQPAESLRYRPNPEAHRLYTLGQYHRNRWNPAGQRKAIEYAEQAIALDPRYAAAHALKAQSWSQLGYFFGVPPREAYPKAEEAAQVALSLDEKLPEAHHAKALAEFFYRWNFPSAEHHLRRALELNPNSPDSRHLFGLLRTVQHRGVEGLTAMKKALEIDPASAWRHVGMTFQYACANQLDAAIDEAKRAHELDPALLPPMFDLYNLYMTRSDHRAAAEWFFKPMALPGSDLAYAESMREAFAKGGIRGLLEARIARSLDRKRPGAAVPALIVAQQFTFLGKKDEAMNWIEQAVEDRQSTALFINVHPMYASLRDHPRFKAIVQRIGL